jgi:hypothetical protein
VYTVVTRCRGREIDKKMCRSRDIRRRKRTAAQWRRETDKVVCLFFYRCGVCRHVPCFFFNLNLGLKLFGPIWRPAPDVLHAVARGAGRALAHPQTTSAPTRPGDRGAAPGGRQPPPLGERGGARFCFFVFVFECRSIGLLATPGCRSDRLLLVKADSAHSRRP